MAKKARRRKAFRNPLRDQWRIGPNPVIDKDVYLQALPASPFHQVRCVQPHIILKHPVHELVKRVGLG